MIKGIGKLDLTFTEYDPENDVIIFYADENSKEEYPYGVSYFYKNVIINLDVSNDNDNIMAIEIFDATKELVMTSVELNNIKNVKISYIDKELLFLFRMINGKIIKRGFHLFSSSRRD